jgi:uncharacterized protein YyaL (SSP411 family)
MRSTPGSAPRPTNRLAGETSAYLRQHMHNPVDWFPWTPEALERARREDRPLLVSIGYSACHWCHVMERESFEDPETAALMNRLFVNVKVDREERPDVDQLYMDTVVRLTGHGGWPLTVFCTPDGRPFYGGTYFPPEPAHGRPSFRQVLEAVDRAWRERRSEVEQSAGTILQALRARPRGVASALPGAEGLARAARELLRGADLEHGGFGGAPKFPMPASLDGLLSALPLLAEDERRACLSFVLLTCREMSRRGLYDQLGGGFHRYCVDAAWTIPHFEKMLYDQGQLLRTYIEAFRISGDEELVWPMRETVEYLRREMTAAEGGLHASQDADSEGQEGRYFVWRPAEIVAVLGPARGAAFCAAYDVSEAGNFEDGASHLVDVARRPRGELAAERAELLAARRRRVPPATDTKRVAAWNGLAISGLARAGSGLEQPDWLRGAAAAADFVLERMRDAEGRLLRVFAEGRATVSAFLDDHAALLEACLDLHRAGAGDRFLAAAEGLADEIARRFFDPDEGELFLTPADGERLAERPRSDADGATPHSAGLAVLGLLRFAALAGRGDLERLAERVIRAHAYAVERMPAAFPTLLRAAALAERGPAVAVIVGDPAAPDTQALARRARRALAPEDAVVVVGPQAPPPSGLDPAWIAGRGAVGGRATAYLCRGTSCSLPIQEPEALAAEALPAREG